MAKGGGDKKSGTPKLADPIPDKGEARVIAAKAVGARFSSSSWQNAQIFGQQFELRFGSIQSFRERTAQKTGPAKFP